MTQPSCFHDESWGMSLMTLINVIAYEIYMQLETPSTVSTLVSMVLINFSIHHHLFFFVSSSSSSSSNS